MIAYDDSDGWYDHVMGPIVRSSDGPSDALNGPGQCGHVPATPPTGFENDRCGFGPRLPLLVISPWAKQNYVDNTLTDQSSITKFIEDNWELGRVGGGSTDAVAGSLGNMFDFNPNGPRAPKLTLDETTGEVVGDGDSGNQGKGGSGDQGSGGEGGQGGKGDGGQQGGQGGQGQQGSGGDGGDGGSQGHRGKGGPKVSCKASGKHSGKHVHVSCTVSDGGSSHKGRETLTLRFAKGANVLASSHTSVHGAHTSVTLSSGKTLSSGSYTLRVAIDTPDGVSGFNQTVKLG